MDPPVANGGVSTRTTAELVVDIAGDAATLVRKEVQLAKQEMAEAVGAKVKAAVALAVAGVLALFALGFLGSAAAYAMENVMRPWAARATVAASFLVLTALIAAIGKAKLGANKPLQRTKETLKEDARWVSTQIKP